MAPSIDTRTSPGFRTVRFGSVEECAADVRRILSASESGHLSCTGNWTPGEIMSHLANWIDYAYVGYPIGAPPFFIRWILRRRLPRMLRGEMPRGVRIPGVKGGTAGMESLEPAQAAHRLLAALKRLQDDEPAKFDSPAFGPMSHDERITLNLRHAELHLGFLKY